MDFPCRIYASVSMFFSKTITSEVHVYCVIQDKFQVFFATYDKYYKLNRFTFKKLSGNTNG